MGGAASRWQLGDWESVAISGLRRAFRFPLAISLILSSEGVAARIRLPFGAVDASYLPGLLVNAGTLNLETFFGQDRR